MTQEAMEALSQLSTLGQITESTAAAILLRHQALKMTALTMVKRGLRSDADAEASTSESDGESADTEHLPTLANKLPDSDIPAPQVLGFSSISGSEA